MNPIQLIVNATLTILLPVIIGAVYWLLRTLAQRYPEHRGPALERYARMSAQYVEQEHGKAPDKQVQANTCCLELFEELGPPAPSGRAIEIAVGSAIFEAEHRGNP